MRKLFLVMLSLALGFAFLPSLAFAQTGSYRTTFQIRNLSTTAAANVQVRFINQDGTVATVFSGPIPAGGSVNFFDLTAAEGGTGWSGNPLATVPAGFNGSVEVLSDQPIVAVTNILQIAGGGIRLGESYSGFNSGDTTFFLPVLMRNNSGFNTWFNVQNVSSSPVQVTINYTPAPGSGNGTPATEGPVTIQSGAAKTFRQDTNAALSGGDPTGVFIGLAKVTSTGGPIVVTVNQENASSGQLLTYNGIGQSAAASTLVAPLLQSNNGGFFTSIAVTNVGTASTNVTITYSPNVATGSGVCPTPSPFTVNNLSPNVGTNIIQIAGNPFSDPQFSGCRYIGSATISSSNGQPLVAVVNQLSLTSKNSSSYEAFNPASATKEVIVPIAQSGTAFSSVQVYNAGSASTSATLSFTPNTATDANKCGNPNPVNIPNIPAGGSVTLIQLAGNFEGADPQFNGCRYIGSATVVGPDGAKLLAVVNQLAFGSGDSLFSYNGFNR
ncbi:hypothetical protein [Roseiflexus sp.]|uniref:hypothetical protein n=1 Tax=Roseiflexus sp. TaxID=2562120 RepID=UPI00398AF95F